MPRVDMGGVPSQSEAIRQIQQPNVVIAQPQNNTPTTEEGLMSPEQRKQQEAIEWIKKNRVYLPQLTDDREKYERMMNDGSKALWYYEHDESAKKLRQSDAEASQQAKEKQDQKASEQNTKEKKEEKQIDINAIEYQWENKDKTDIRMSDAAVVQQFVGVFGAPYQFSEEVDPVPLIDKGSETTEEDTIKIGQKYNEKIFSVAPILFLTPGTPRFMSGYNNKAALDMATKLSQCDLDDEPDNQKPTKFDDGRYYSFQSEWTEFRNYANLAIRVLALYLGIDKYRIPIPGKSDLIALRSFDIDNYVGDQFRKRLGTSTALAFFLDGVDSISESFNNSTTQSALASMTQQYSQAAREARFLFDSDSDDGNLFKKATENLQDAVDKFARGSSELAQMFLGKSTSARVIQELTTVVTGGKILFPEIWSDSSYGKSYNIQIKLRSPDPDPISVFMNIFIPIILLVSLAAPHQNGNSSNSFKAPFLVRAIYKSIFSCDLGIIESINITRGGDHRWNRIGLPLSADVDISIKDLYGTMMISRRWGIISKTAQLDYLANLAGLNLNDDEAGRKIKLLSLIAGNVPEDIIKNKVYGFGEAVTRRLVNFPVMRTIFDPRWFG